MPGGPAGESLPAGPARASPAGESLAQAMAVWGVDPAGWPAGAGPARGEPAQGGNPARLPAGPAGESPPGGRSSAPAGGFRGACRRADAGN